MALVIRAPLVRTFGMIERLRDFRESEPGLTLETLCEQTGISVSQLSRYEKGGRDPKLDHLLKLARRFNTTVAALIGEPSPTSVPLVSWVQAGRLSASHPVFARDVLRHVSVADLPPGDWMALEVEGDSMDRVAPSGSVIVLNRNETEPADRRFYVFGTEEGEATFKRFRSGPPRLQPFSTNPDHETHYIADTMIVIGRVHRVITDLR